MNKKESVGNRRYTAEFKVEAVRLTESIGCTEAAKRLGVPYSSLWNWLQLSRSGKLKAVTGVAGLLSIMLCLKGSRGTLESGLKHGIKLRKDSEGAAGAASPATVLERRDGHSELKLQGILGMEIATT